MIRGKASTTVTWLPRAWKINANSQPITPPPMIRMDSGIVFRVRASLLERMWVPSKGKAGKTIGREPEAMIILSTGNSSSPSLISPYLDQPGIGQKGLARRPVGSL